METLATQANVLLVRYSSRSAGLDHGHIDGSLSTEKGEVKKRLTDACSMIHKLSHADCACKTLRSYRRMFDVRRFLAHSLQFFVICSVHSIQNVEPLAKEKVNCTKMHRKEKVILGL